MIIHGSPSRVLDQLIAMVDEIGRFGTLLLTHKDWNDNRELHRRSMRLFAEQVMPKFKKYMVDLRVGEFEQARVYSKRNRADLPMGR